MALGVAEEHSAQEHLLSYLDGVDGDVVHLLHDRLIGHAIGEHVLAVFDDDGVGDAERYDLVGHVVEELVAVGHHLVQGSQFQIVFDHVGQTRGCPRLEADVAVGIEKSDFHRVILSASISRVRPYLSASAAA